MNTHLFVQLLILLSMKSQCLSHRSHHQHHRHHNDNLVCQNCGASVANTSQIFNRECHKSKSVRKEKQIFGIPNVTIHELMNLAGEPIQLITAKKARCTSAGGLHYQSWFPNYGWRICVCKRCGQQVGWTFVGMPTEESVEISKTPIETSTTMEENFTSPGETSYQLSKAKKIPDKFYGLIVDSVVETKYADSHLTMPPTILV